MFAQVTYPPIDCIREELITGTETLLGAEGNLLDPRPESCARITLPTFLLGEDDMGRLRAIQRPDYHAVTLAIRFPVAGGAESLRLTLESIFAQAAEAVRAAPQPADPFGLEPGPGACAHPGAAGRRRVAPPSDPRRFAYAGEYHPGIRRAARGASFRHIARLRRRCHPSIPGAGQRGGTRIGRHRRRDPRGRCAEAFPQGHRQGRGEGDGEDGHLHGAVLPRGADLRGARPAKRSGGKVLHRHRFPHRRHRARNGRRRRAAAAPDGLPGAAGRARPAGGGRRLPVAQGRRAPRLQPHHHPVPAVRRAHERLRAV